MAVLAWGMMGLAIWHFTIWLPDRFWGGIVGALIGALIGAVLFALGRSTGSRSRRVTTPIWSRRSRRFPGALIGLAAIWFEGVRRERARASGPRWPDRTSPGGDGTRHAPRSFQFCNAA